MVQYAGEGEDEVIVVPKIYKKAGADYLDQQKIKRYNAQGMSIIEIAEAMDIDPNCIRNWVRHFNDDGKVADQTGIEAEKKIAEDSKPDPEDPPEEKEGWEEE